MARPAKLTIDLVGEGLTDIGPHRGAETSESPNDSVLGTLVKKLCGEPKHMVVHRRPVAHLEGRGLAKKVELAKRTARIAHRALVFVVDSDGDLSKLKQLKKGRDRGHANVPTAVGVAHPCIEAWLLADAHAIRRAMGLASKPDVPAQPESLPADRDDRQHPKRLLAGCAGSGNPDLKADDKVKIARAIRSLDVVRTRCPLSFAPFAAEVEAHIKPLFGSGPGT